MNNDHLTALGSHLNKPENTPHEANADLLNNTLASKLSNFLSAAFKQQKIKTIDNLYREQTLVKYNNKVTTQTSSLLDSIYGEYSLSTDNDALTDATQILTVNMPLAIAAQPTTIIDIDFNLDPSFSECKTPLLARNYAQSKSSMTIYDINGQAQTISFLFSKVQVNTWHFYALIDGQDVTPTILGYDKNAHAIKLYFNNEGEYIGKHPSFEIAFKSNTHAPTQQITVNHHITQNTESYSERTLMQNGSPIYNFSSMNITAGCFMVNYGDDFMITLGMFEDFLLSSIISLKGDGVGKIHLRLPPHSQSLKDLTIFSPNNNEQAMDSNALAIDFRLAIAPTATTTIIYGLDIENEMNHPPKIPFTVNNDNGLVESHVYNFVVNYYVYSPLDTKYLVDAYFVKSSIPNIWHVNFIVKSSTGVSDQQLTKVLSDQRFTLVFDNSGNLIQNSSNSRENHGSIPPTSTSAITNKGELPGLSSNGLSINGQQVSADRLTIDTLSYSDVNCSALNIANAINVSCMESIGIIASPNQNRFDLGAINRNVKIIILADGDLVINGISIIGAYKDFDELTRDINELGMIPNITAKIHDDRFIIYNSSIQSNGMNITIETNGQIITQELFNDSPFNNDTKSLVARGTITLHPRIIGKPQECDPIIIGGNNPEAIGFSAGIKCGIMHTSSDNIELCFLDDNQVQSIKVFFIASIGPSRNLIFLIAPDGGCSNTITNILMDQDGFITIDYGQQLLTLGQVQIKDGCLDFNKKDLSGLECDSLGRMFLSSLANEQITLVNSRTELIKILSERYPTFFVKDDILSLFAIMSSLFSNTQDLEEFNQEYKNHHAQILSISSNINKEPQAAFIPLTQGEYSAFTNTHRKYRKMFATNEYSPKYSPVLSWHDTHNPMMLQLMIEHYQHCLRPVATPNSTVLFSPALEELSITPQQSRNLTPKNLLENYSIYKTPTFTSTH